MNNTWEHAGNVMNMGNENATFVVRVCLLISPAGLAEAERAGLAGR